MMFDWFKKTVAQIEQLGPDAPKVKIPALIQGYALNAGNVHLTLVIGGKHTIVCAVPSEVPNVLPVGTKVRLVVEKTE